MIYDCSRKKINCKRTIFPIVTCIKLYVIPAAHLIKLFFPSGYNAFLRQHTIIFFPNTKYQLIHTIS